MKTFNFITMFFLILCPVGESLAYETFSVGEVSVTVQQYDYIYANFINEYEDRTGSPPPADSIAAWVDALRNRLYLLADAARKGYTNDPFVNRIVHRAEITMLIQVNGMLYNEVVMKHVNISDADIADEYEHSQFEYDIRYIGVPVGTDFTEAEFDRAYNAGTGTNTAGTMTLILPLGPFYADRNYILSLKPGEVSRPLKTDHGLRIIRIDTIKPVIRKSFEEIAPSFRRALELYEEFRIRDEYEDDIHRMAHTAVDTAAVGRFADRLGSGKSAGIDTTAVHDIRNLVLATYVRDVAPVRITVTDFLDYYNSLFMRKRLADAAVVTMYLREMVFEVYAYADAVARGLNQTETFINDFWNFKNTVILGEYEKREIDPKIVITDADSREYYDAHRDRFVDGEVAVADILTFSSRTDAERMRMRLTEAAGTDSARVPEPDIKYTTEQDVTISHDSADFPDDIRAMMFAMEDGRVSRVIEGNKEGKTARVFVKKTETGRRQQPFEEVQKTIHRELFKEKKATYKCALIDSLKTVYSMTER